MKKQWVRVFGTCQKFQRWDMAEKKMTAASRWGTQICGQCYRSMAGGHRGIRRALWQAASERPSMASPASARLETVQQIDKQGVQTENLLDPPAEREHQGLILALTQSRKVRFIQGRNSSMSTKHKQKTHAQRQNQWWAETFAYIKCCISLWELFLSALIRTIRALNIIALIRLIRALISSALIIPVFISLIRALIIRILIRVMMRALLIRPRIRVVIRVTRALITWAFISVVVSVLIETNQSSYCMSSWHLSSIFIN